MTVSSADLPVFSWMSTGMPRPLSQTVTRPSCVDDDLDVVAEAGHAFVDGVVGDLVDQVVEAALVGAADVHAGAAAYGFQPAEHLDVAAVYCALLARWRVDAGALVSGPPAGLLVDAIGFRVLPSCRAVAAKGRGR